MKHSDKIHLIQHVSVLMNCSSVLLQKTSQHTLNCGSSVWGHCVYTHRPMDKTAPPSIWLPLSWEFMELGEQNLELAPVPTPEYNDYNDLFTSLGLSSPTQLLKLFLTDFVVSILVSMSEFLQDLDFVGLYCFQILSLMVRTLCSMFFPFLFIMM